MSYLFLKWLHVVGATVLLGTGAGIAWFMVRAHRTRDPHVVAAVAAEVVRADMWFTATAVILQPVSGLLMMMSGGWTLGQSWLGASILLYLLVGCCWLPVIWLQKRMRDVARDAVANQASLPASYFSFYRRWLALGWLGFTGVLLIVWLMVSKQV